MAKKGSFVKTLLGVAAVAATGKVVYDKYRITKERYSREEDESGEDTVKKYNAICESKIVEIEDEAFEGCEMKAVTSKMTLDLSLAEFDKDVYINFKSTASSVVIVLPEGVNVICDIEKVGSSVHNLVENSDEDGLHTVYIIGEANVSAVDIVPASFYADDGDFEDEEDMPMSAEETQTEEQPEETQTAEVKNEEPAEAEKSAEAEEIPVQEVQ